MKENNKVKYLLGIGLFSVWGLVGFRFYEKSTHKNDLTFHVREDEPISSPLSQFEYSLSSDYTDPFLGALTSKINHKSSNPNTNSNRNINLTKKKIEKQNVKFPSILYKGNIVDQSGRITAILSIDNILLNLGVNSKTDDLEITQISIDSLVVRKEGVFKTVKRL